MASRHAVTEGIEKLSPMWTAGVVTVRCIITVTFDELGFGCPRIQCLDGGRTSTLAETSSSLEFSLGAGRCQLTVDSLCVGVASTIFAVGVASCSKETILLQTIQPRNNKQKPIYPTIPLLVCAWRACGTQWTFDDSPSLKTLPSARGEANKEQRTIQTISKPTTFSASS